MLKCCCCICLLGNHLKLHPKKSMKFIGRHQKWWPSLCPNLASPSLFFQSFWSFYIDAEEMELQLSFHCHWRSIQEQIDSEKFFNGASSFKPGTRTLLMMAAGITLGRFIRCYVAESEISITLVSSHLWVETQTTHPQVSISLALCVHQIKLHWKWGWCLNGRTCKVALSFTLERVPTGC